MKNILGKTALALLFSAFLAGAALADDPCPTGDCGTGTNGDLGQKTDATCEFKTNTTGAKSDDPANPVGVPSGTPDVSGQGG